jgi:radical SAM protein with 4Fe4S-binding SPASM domain
MLYFLSRNAVLKWLETPSVYHINKDDLYELDDTSFHFLKTCISETGCTTSEKKFIRYCLKEDILTKDNVIVRRPPLLKAHEPSLRYLELQITSKCNLKCKHCYIGDADLSELSLTQVKNILTEFEEMQGLRVLITGGEPLVHSKFREINEMLPDFFLRKVLFSNGLLLNKSILGYLNVNEIQISIDGLEAAHDSLRGRGAYKAALKAARLAIDSGFEVSIATMVHRKNLDDFDEMDRLFKRMGVRDWTVDIPCKTGRLNYNNEFHLSPELGGKYFSYGYGSGLHSGASGFACGLHLMAVMADGRVAKCSFYADDPAGVTEDGLEKCWQRIKPVRIEELQCNCSFVEECRGGCRYRAKLFGDPLGKDLYKCNFYDKIKK